LFGHTLADESFAYRKRMRRKRLPENINVHSP
jgi:hypothetical protein